MHQSDTITIGFTGDTMLGRLTNEQISKTSYEYPWGNISRILQHNDVNIVNLETTLTKSDQIVPKVFNFKADPDKVKALQKAPIGVVNLANNHILDFSVEGMAETLQILDNAAIAHVGAGVSQIEAQKPVIKKLGKLTLGIIGMTDNEPTWQAGPEKPGTFYVNIDAGPEAWQEALEAVKKLKEEVDICVVSLHWGPNMQEFPDEIRIKFAHALIDAGCDIIHGHSAHVVQGIEIYQNKIIMYDTGDFVDDYMVYPILRNDLSFLFLVKIQDKKIAELRLIPTKIENMQVNRAHGNDAKTIIELFKKRTKPFGTQFSLDNHELKIFV